MANGQFGKEGGGGRGKGDFKSPHSAAHPENVETRMLPGKRRRQNWERQPRTGGGRRVGRGRG